MYLNGTSTISAELNVNDAVSKVFDVIFWTEIHDSNTINL